MTEARLIGTFRTFTEAGMQARRLATERGQTLSIRRDNDGNWQLINPGKSGAMRKSCNAGSKPVSIHHPRQDMHAAHLPDHHDPDLERFDAEFDLILEELGDSMASGHRSAEDGWFYSDDD